MSSRPKRATAASTIFATATGSVTSAIWTAPSPPADWIDERVSSASARDTRALTTTAAPAAASASEIARPMLRAPPVTSATFPESSRVTVMVLSYRTHTPFTERLMLATENRVRVFWQPGCTSCLRTKEFLTKQGVDYESINVHGNPDGMEELRKLGARSVPIVARGDKFVFAQTLTDVIQFLELKIKQQEQLSPEQLMQKMDLVLTAAARFIRQIPQDELEKPFRNRNRPKRVLGHHIFRIVEGFLESMKDGKILS